MPSFSLEGLAVADSSPSLSIFSPRPTSSFTNVALVTEETREETNPSCTRGDIYATLSLTSCALQRWIRPSRPRTPRFCAATAAGCGRRPAPGPPATTPSRVSQAAPRWPSPPPLRTHLQFLLGPVGSGRVPELGGGGGDLPDDASALGRASRHKGSQELSELTCIRIKETVTLAICSSPSTELGKG